MSQDVQVTALRREPRAVRRFLQVSYGIYDGDPLWVAPLLFDLEKVFTDANPFFEHAEMSLWIAVQGGRDVGRIAGIIDRNHNEQQHDQAAFFGFFESVQDAAVSQALFRALAEWARQKGQRRLVGPMNPSINDECGLLVDGFDSPPTFMMTYNPRYYVGLLAAEGFQKARDLLAYSIDLAKCPLDRLKRIADRCRQRYPELTVRPVLRKHLEADLTKIKEVYNAAWGDNWGYVPMTDAEVHFMAERLKPLLLEGLVWLAESATEPVGFLLAIPDFNQAIQPLRGRLLTPRVLGFLPYFLGWRVPTRGRVITLGVKDRYRSHGLESVMLYEGLQVGFKVGFTSSEASWILEENVKMRRVIELFGASVYKTYRLYERSL